MDIETRGGAVLLGPHCVLYYTNQRGILAVLNLITGEVVDTVNLLTEMALTTWFDSSLGTCQDGEHFVVTNPRYHGNYESNAYLYKLGAPGRSVKPFDNARVRRPLVYHDTVHFVDAMDHGFQLTQDGLYHFHVANRTLRLSLDGELVAELSPGMEAVGCTAACLPWIACAMNGSPSRVFWWHTEKRKVYRAVADVGNPLSMVVASNGYVVVWGHRGHYLLHPARAEKRLVTAGRRLPSLGLCAVFEDIVTLPWAKLRQVLLGHSQQQGCWLSVLPRELLALVLGCISTIRFTSLSVVYISLSCTSDTRTYRPQLLCVDCETGELSVDTTRPHK